MPNESFATTVVVEVEGSLLPPDVAPLLASATVEDSTALPTAFVLRFRDQDGVVVTKGGVHVGVALRIRLETSEPGQGTTLVDGEVAALTTEVGAEGTVVEVRGFDRAHRLMRGRRVVAYPELEVADVVRRVAQRAGLQPGRIDAFPGVGGSSGTQISQDDLSDWDFLVRLARRVGAQVSVDGKALDFRLLADPQGAPDLTEHARQNPLVLEVGTSLLSLRATMTASAQVPEVTARGWDAAQKQPLTATATPRAVEATIGTVDPAGLGTTFGAPPLLAASSRLGTQTEVTAAAEAAAAAAGGGAVEVEGVARGNPKLRAGAAVALVGVGEPFLGRYTLTSTRHVVAADAGYTTSFVVSAGRDRSLGRLTGGARAATPELGSRLVPGVVSDVRDPDEQGRVRLTFPWLSADFTSSWARCVAAGAGQGRGLVTLPEVGDEVLVGFDSGDVDRPYVLGGLHNAVDPLPDTEVAPVDTTSGQQVMRALVSRTGHRLELAEAATSPDGVLLATGDDTLTIRLDQKKGTVAITGARGVSVDAGAGPLDLSGTTVSVTATGPLKLDGAQVTVTGSVEASVSAPLIRLN